MTRGHANSVNEIEVSLAIERLLIANFPTSWTPAKIDFAALPSGYYDMGSVVEDTPVVTGARKSFELHTGLPKTLQFISPNEIDGMFKASLHSNSWRKIQFAFGNYTWTASAAAVGTISSVHASGLTFVLATTPTTPLAVGQQIILSSLSFDDPDALEVRIGSINTGNLIYTVSTQPIKAITAGLTVGVFNRVSMYFGSSQVKYYSLLGVAEFVDGSQVVHELQKVRPDDNYEEMYRPTENGKVPLSFKALSFISTINGCPQSVIFGRHFFPPTPGAACG